MPYCTILYHSPCTVSIQMCKVNVPWFCQRISDKGLWDALFLDISDRSSKREARSLCDEKASNWTWANVSLNQFITQEKPIYNEKVFFCQIVLVWNISLVKFLQTPKQFNSTVEPLNSGMLGHSKIFYNYRVHFSFSSLSIVFYED